VSLYFYSINDLVENFSSFLTQDDGSSLWVEFCGFSSVGGFSGCWAAVVVDAMAKINPALSSNNSTAGKAFSPTTVTRTVFGVLSTFGDGHGW
jgi:hypothetical protein